MATIAHDLQDPKLKAAYRVQIQETMDQCEAIFQTGLMVEFNDGADPQGNRTVVLGVELYKKFDLPGHGSP